MKYEYRVWNIDPPGKWHPLNATNKNSATQELMAMGPNYEEAVIREVGTTVVQKQTEPYGRNGGVRCSTSRGPCDCGAWH